jgi:hypothetical protein
MFFTYLKLVVVFLIPVATAVYARQQRNRDDIAQITAIVTTAPPRLSAPQRDRWLALARSENHQLNRLIADMDN